MRHSGSAAGLWARSPGCVTYMGGSLNKFLGIASNGYELVMFVSTSMTCADRYYVAFGFS